MSTVQFSFSDLILAMTAFICTLLALVYFVAQKQKHSSKPLLVCFLLAHALIAIHEMTYYGEQFRYTILKISPNLFFIGSFAYCIDAVLLYLFTKAVIYRDFSIKRVHALHLLPLAGYFVYMMFVYYSLGHWPKHRTIWNWLLTESWHYKGVDLSIHIIRVGYGILCLRLISLYREQQKKSHSDLSSVDLTWLKVVVMGFLCVMAGDASLSLIKAVSHFIYIDVSVFISLGKSLYYATFILLLALLGYTIAKLSLVEQIEQKSVEDFSDQVSGFKPDYIERIEAYMRQKKPYLDPEITIDVLAKELDVSSNALSVTLNQHFQMNFYEFINRYRIEEAKKMLINDSDKTITQIFYDVGFNSKSVFNTFFRKCEGLTPSAYRKQFGG